MGRVIMIASGKGGTGKTTAAANIGAALAARGKLVLLADMDMGLRNLDIALGLESKVVYDISDVAEKRCAFDDALLRDGRFENLYFIPATQTRSQAALDDESVEELRRLLKNRFDFCIIDAPAGMDGGFNYAAEFADEVIMVTVPETAALRDADRVISVLEDMGMTEMRLIINRVRADLISKGIMKNVDDCVDILSIPVLGIVPEDPELYISALKGEPAVLNDKSAARQAFLNISGRILGEDIPIMDFGEKEGFLMKIKRIFGKKAYNAWERKVKM